MAKKSNGPGPKKSPTAMNNRELVEAKKTSAVINEVKKRVAQGSISTPKGMDVKKSNPTVFMDVKRAEHKANDSKRAAMLPKRNLPKAPYTPGKGINTKKK